jgi:hypothetical protein
MFLMDFKGKKAKRKQKEKIKLMELLVLMDNSIENAQLNN